MNVASSTYRRFTKELLQKNSEQTTFGNHNVIQSESDSGYQSSSSVEPLNKPVAIYNAKRTLQMHQFAPESHEVNTSFKPESQPIVSPKFHLNAHSNRLSRLKIDASSKFVPSFNENTAKPESQSSATAEAQVLDETLSESTIQTSQENTNSEEEQSFKECFESETFTSATSSPSHAHESGTVFTEDHKSDTLCSVSDSSAIDFIEDSAQVDAATPKVKVAPKVKTTYIRFDSRRLMNPISLPAVHPAAQPRSSIGPLASKTDKKKSPNDLFEREQLEDNITRQEPFAFNSSCRGSSSIISNQALFFSSTDLASGAGIASAPTSASVSTSPAFKPSTGPFKNEKLGPGPDSLGGFNYVESRQNTRRAKRNANEKKRQERELLIADFNSKLSGEDIMGAFDALFKLSFNGAQDWIKANLSSSLGTVSNPLRFALKLVEFWTMRSNQRHSPSHERALSWLLNPLSSIVLELGERLHLSLSEEDASYMREKVIVLGPSLSPRIWANLINLLELCISEELLIQKARELLTNVGRLDDLYFFVKELSLQTLLPFDELFVPLIRTKHYAWASELALGNPILLHQLVMAVLPVDAKQSLRIILDCSMNLDAYSTIEVAAKLPELSALMHQGLLLEFVELICGSNYSLQVEISKSALTSGHTIEFGKLCSLFGITLRDLDIDESFEIIENCSICQQNEIATETLDKKFLELSVPVIFDPSDCDLEYFLLSSSLVAFDLEFRPKFCQFCRADSLKAATLQLATPNCCLVLDLMSPLGENRLEILRSVFENPDILKLGFGIENDLQLLATTLTDSYFQKACSVLDLQKVVAKLARVESARRVADIGLSQACELVLDIQLDKAEQISNWEHRPLRESQIQYAALDSYCLILLSENLVDSCVITESLCTSDDCSSIQDDFSILLSMTENEININI